MSGQINVPVCRSTFSLIDFRLTAAPRAVNTLVAALPLGFIGRKLLSAGKVFPRQESAMADDEIFFGE
jgi:hypothetical protein